MINIKVFGTKAKKPIIRGVRIVKKKRPKEQYREKSFWKKEGSYFAYCKNLSQFFFLVVSENYRPSCQNRNLRTLAKFWGKNFFLKKRTRFQTSSDFEPIKELESTSFVQGCHNCKVAKKNFHLSWITHWEKLLKKFKLFLTFLGLCVIFLDFFWFWQRSSQKW